MEENKIREVAEKVGVKEVELFVKFFSKRFPNENNEIISYVTEWAERFLGNPIPFMDNQSLAIYNEIKNEQ